jgi:hypothetical protein
VRPGASLVRDGLCGERFDVLLSCLASRTGVPKDAWAIDYQAHVLVFGNGALTACKSISDDDLSDYLAGYVHDAGRHNRVLPISGPGDAMTPLQQGKMLFALMGRTPRFKHVPVRLPICRNFFSIS